MKITACLILLVVAVTVHGKQGGTQVKAPVSAEGLIRLLDEKIPLPDIIRTIKDRGVSFQSLQPVQDEIRAAGKNLSQRELNELFAVVSDNFRQPNNLPYRVSFMSLKGVAINLFLDRRIDKEWDEALGTRNYFIARNDVYKSLKQLMAMFSSRSFGQNDFSNEFEAGVDTHSDEKLAKFYRIKRRPLFVGSIGEPTGDGWSAFPGSEHALTVARSMNDPNEQWRLIEIEPDDIFTETQPPRRDLYTFRKFLEKEELKFFAPSRLAAFYSHITRNYFPPDFGVIDLGIERTEEPDDEVCESKPGKLQTGVGLIGPLLKLNVAILENISDKPIYTGRLFTRMNNVEMLRTREKDRTSLNSAPFQQSELFSSRVLRPGEKLVIPIELSLTIDNWESWGSPTASADNLEEFSTELSRVREAGGLKFPGLPRRFRVTADSIERMLRSPRLDFAAAPEYLYGPSISIEGIEIDSYGYLVRHFDPKKLSITTNGVETGGSCPYVYTFVDSKWLSEGVILYGQDSKTKEAIDEKALRRFDGRILIRERDPETSFIDLLEIRAISRDGSEKTLYARNEQLRVADEQYVKLDHGQQLLVEFEMPPSFVATKYILVASGYYVPYGNQPSRSTQRHVWTSQIFKRRR